MRVINIYELWKRKAIDLARRSEERSKRNREKRTMLYGLIAMAFLFILASVLMIGAFSGGGTDGISGMFVTIKHHLIELWDVIWFKISNFFDFVKRGILS